MKRREGEEKQRFRRGEEERNDKKILDNTDFVGDIGSHSISNFGRVVHANFEEKLVFAVSVACFGRRSLRRGKKRFHS